MNTTRTCPECGKPLAANGLQGLCPECMLKVGLATKTAETVPAGAGDPPPSPAPPPIAEISRLFPQLEILECLGSGGMGTVYKARQPRLDRLVALKVLAVQREDQSRNARFAERFEREARALAKLNHPNIVTMYEFGQAEGRHYFIMEFVDGLNLRQLERAGKLTPRQALQVVPQVCEALQFAHDEGVVHRDIKPENILVDRKGRVKIADFGIAKMLGREASVSTLTQGEAVIGTPHYMAPEQVEKPQTVDHRADIYSLGVVFYEMLTGELPLGKFAPPSRKVQVDVRLDEVVLHSLEKEPDRRYQHASDLRTDVVTIAGSTNRPPAAAGPDLPSTPAAARRSDFVRIVEILSGVTFTSPLALKLVNLSALGFLGALAFLGFVPLPGWHRCFGFSGFAGFFGLTGAAYVVELVHRRHAKALASTIGGSAGAPPAGATTPLHVGGVAILVGILLVATALVVFAVAWGRNGEAKARLPRVTVTGVVTDSVSGKQIAGARVNDNYYATDIRVLPQEGWADSAGEYVLHTLYRDHSLMASAPGYETKVANLKTKTSGREQLVRLNFQLAPIGGPGVAERHFVCLVGSVESDGWALTFEGEPTTWEGLPARLAQVPERARTVLEYAVTSRAITLPQFDELQSRVLHLAQELGFEYASDVGIRPKGSTGSRPSKF